MNGQTVTVNLEEAYIRCLWNSLYNTIYAGRSQGGEAAVQEIKAATQFGKLDLHSPATHNETFMRLSVVICTLQCLHKETGKSERHILDLGANTRRQAYVQNSQ